MKKTRLLMILVIALSPLSLVFAAQGKIIGEHEYSLPSWFKLSFLEIQEDVREAQAANKHIMLFMHIDRCPYCIRLLDENFNGGKNMAFIQKHFDVIALNIRGDREISWDENTTYNEKSLAKALKIMATPTVVFLNPQGKKVYQMNGYRKPAAFKHVLNYVNDKQYNKIKFIDYLAQQQKPVYQFKSHPAIANITDLSKVQTPLAVLFEDSGCDGCDEFHREVLQHKDVLAELKAITLVRLDANSTTPIIDPKGNKTTAKDWAKALKMDYRPGTVLFDEGSEITRIEGRIYHFHYKELLRYVSGGHYFQHTTYLSYLDKRIKQLLKDGVDIDFGQ